MSKRDLDALVTFASTFAKLCFDTQGEFYPVWHMVHGDGKHCVLPPPPTNDKDEAVAMVKAYMLQNDVIRYVFTTEAWMVARTHEITDEEVNKIVATGPANEPDAVEIIQILAEDQDYGEILGHFKINRPKAGKPFLSDFVLDDNPTIAEGRMVSLLPRKGTLQ